MKRILEEELMEDDIQAKAYAQADFEKPNGMFITLFNKQFRKRNIEGFVLDLGCGPGDIMVRFARAYPKVVIHGLDGSEAMLRQARKIRAAASDVNDRLKYIQGILPGACLPLKKYDVIISNSLLHQLYNPQVLWEAVKTFARKDAPVFIMDLKRPSSAEGAENYVETYSTNEPEILKRDFYNSLLAAFEVDEVKDQLRQANLQYLSVKEVSDRHLLISGIYA